MLTEQSAYTNRWRAVSPLAKGIFSLCGMLAAFVADSPRGAFAVALIILLVTIMGASVPPSRYFRVAVAPLLFLGASVFSLAVSLNLDSFTMQLAGSEFPRILKVGSRSLTSLASLLFLVLTTPLSDIIALLRRCHIPETLLDLMTLSYRTIFVLSESVHDTVIAQSARLGYATARHSLRSLGSLTANLTLQVWQRSHALHLAAEARCNDGALRFLGNSYSNSGLHISIAAAGGFLIIFLSVMLR